MPTFVYAAEAGDRDIRFDLEGNLHIRITSTAATTGIKYRTIGWIVTTQPMCKDYDGTYDCRPTEIKHVLFYNSATEELTDPNPPVPGEPVTSHWIFDKETVET